jgi:hypothetical protein
MLKIYNKRGGVSINNQNELETEKNINFEGLDAKEIWNLLYNKELTSKKSILEYIDITKILKNSNATIEQIEDTYSFIYKSIDDLGSLIKVNTNLHLKNQLKAQLGKYVKEKDPKPVNHFIEFFKEAYPENNRRKDFTWVLMDINKITEEQIWTTLTYINAWCLKDNKLDENQKKDIIKIVELLISRKNIKYINQLKSLEKLHTNLNIKLVTEKGLLKVKTKH